MFILTAFTHRVKVDDRVPNEPPTGYLQSVRTHFPTTVLKLGPVLFGEFGSQQLLVEIQSVTISRRLFDVVTLNASIIQHLQSPGLHVSPRINITKLINITNKIDNNLLMIKPHIIYFNLPSYNHYKIEQF